MSNKNSNRSNQVSKKKSKKPQTTIVRAQPRANSTIPRSMNSQGHSQMVSRICGLTDPFCIHARGTKYPDSSSMRTIPYTREVMYTLDSDSNGRAWGLFNLTYNFDPFTDASAASGPNVTAWSAFPSATVIASVASYRIVSAGIKISRVSAPLTSAGILNVRTWPIHQNSELTPIDITSYSASESQDFAIQDSSEITVTFPQSSQLRTTFYNVSSDSGNATSGSVKGFLPVTVCLSGAPINTTMLMMKVIIHYELAFDPESGMGQLATPPPPANALLTNVAATVSSSISNIMKNGVKAVGDYIVHKAKASLTTALMGPQAGAIALLVD